MKLDFNNRVALVTGAGRGIGKTIAAQLAAQGVIVICVSRNPDNCQAVAQELEAAGGQAYALAVDVSDSAAVSAAAEEVLTRYGTVDILVNNAGITRDGLVMRMTNDDWDSVLQTNLSSCFYWIKGLIRPMTRKRWGRVINITSVVGLMGNAGQVNYAAAKAGMIGFTKSLARELASRNITVNAVAPGFIETDMTAVLSDDIQQQVLKQIPLGKMGQSDDIANVVTYLSAEQAGYITGQVFSIDGGMAM